MTNAAIAITAAALLALFAGWYYRRGPLKKKAAFFLFFVRFIALVLLGCAFIQPSFTVKTLVKDENGVAVFIDASRSMGLFKLDSLLKRLSSLGDLSRSSSRATLDCRFFFFGDSLRSCDPAEIRNCSFSDKRSFFPQDLSPWRTIIILSDGNWSNPSLSPDLVANKQCYFYTMPTPSPRPFLRMHCISFQSPITKDSLSVATLSIDGYKSDDQPFDIDVRQGSKSVFHRLRAMNQGYFNDTLLIAFPTKSAGKFLYGIKVRSRIDSLHCLLHLIASVIPSSFTTRIVSSSPTLDARFLSLALNADRSWKMVNDRENIDALFLMDWDTTSKKAFFNQKPSGVAAFIGCLPCSTWSIVAADSLALFSKNTDDSLSQRILQRNLPSPLSIVAIPRSSLPPLRTTIACVARLKEPRVVRYDTLPFLCEGVIGGHDFIALTTRNCWSMDFLPLSLDEESETGSLLRDVISIVKESAIQKTNSAFIMYPSLSGQSEFDSCAFNTVLPREFNETQGAADKSASARIDLTIYKGEQRIVDTAFSPSWGALSGAQTVQCHPLPSGTYFYTARLSFGKKRFSYEDTMIVGAYDLERTITGQNTILLSQIATALDGTDPRLLSDIIERNSKLQKNSMTVRVFQLKRSWLLFALIVALFSLEWAIRRMNGLDG